MPITKDNAAYDQLHERLLRDMLLAIKDELDEAELDHDEVHELTANIALAISAILDGTSPLSVNGQKMMPFLAFTNEAQRDHLIVNEQGSYLHEIVDTLFEEMDQLDEDDEDEDDEDDYEYDEDEDEEDEDDEEDEEEDDDATDRRH
jgi:hypothetical protein